MNWTNIKEEATAMWTIIFKKFKNYIWKTINEEKIKER